MFGRSIQLKITLGFLVLGITACKDKHSQNQLNAEIHTIEAHLDLNGSELSTLQRLQKINLALAKQEDFETSIITLSDVDTISFGETLKVHFIPVRTSKIDKR